MSEGDASPPPARPSSSSGSGGSGDALPPPPSPPPAATRTPPSPHSPSLPGADAAEDDGDIGVAGAMASVALSSLEASPPLGDTDTAPEASAGPSRKHHEHEHSSDSSGAPSPSSPPAPLPASGSAAPSPSASSTSQPAAASRSPSASPASRRRHHSVSHVSVVGARSASGSARSSTDSSQSQSQSAARPAGTFSPRIPSPPKFRSVEVPLPSLAAAAAGTGAGANPRGVGGSRGSGGSSGNDRRVLLEEADDDGVVDETAPFESIALDPTAPPPPILPAQIISQGHGRSHSASAVDTPKRHSWKREPKSDWGGFGVDAKGQPVAHGSLPVHPLPAVKTDRENGSAGGDGPSPTSATSSVSGASTPQRHAPPAHPHPFSLPTTPNASQAPLPAPVPHVHGLGVKGVSTLDKFISRTRPQHLPPKSRNEDQEHLHAWEDMMAKSKEHEAERKKVQEQKRLEKERHIIMITPEWETLLNDPDFSVSKVRNNSTLRRLWFEGVPPRLRGQAWSQAIGNPLALNKDAYRGYLRRAQRAQAQGRFPAHIAEQMEKDINQTLPTLHVFHKGSPLRQDLRDLISAWVVYRSDQARGYAPNISLVAGMFLLASSPSVAFLSLVNFLSRPCLSAFYNEVPDEVDAYYRVFENLQADMFPRIFANCKNLGLRLPETYFRSVLVEQVPFAVACRLWDQIMLEGDGYIFRAALAIFGFLEPRLYYPDKEEILSVLEGRNSATNAIVQRERERARLRGEEYEEALDGKLSVFGLHEEPLFEWLEHDGWKESRFDRLVMRELPD